MLRVLIGGEATRTIASAFEARGHYVLTADFRPCQKGGNHHQGNWRDVWDQGFDLAIFHHTCTNMANSGSKHIYRNGKKENGLDEGRWIDLGRAAWQLWKECEDCPVEVIANENPVMLRYAQIMAELHKRDKWDFQSVQPWWFGTDPKGLDNVTKETCWWTTKGALPKLQKTGLLDGSTAREEVFRMAPTKDPNERRMERSNFTPGHADAIADQWGGAVEKRKAAKAAA